MCIVSNVGDYWRKNTPNRFPEGYHYVTTNPTITREEVQQLIKEANTPLEKELKELKRDLQELRELLKAAKTYDEMTDQHECETDEKVELIKKFAELLGVDMKGVF